MEGKRCGEGRERRLDLAKARLGELDQVDLVHRQHDMADAEQGDDGGMPARLLDQALARIDQQDGELGIGGAGRHVARVLLVARRVGDDEGAPGRGEEAIGDVDGDALLALGLQPVEQQGEVELVLGRAEAPRIVAQRGDLVVMQAAPRR